MYVCKFSLLTYVTYVQMLTELSNSLLKLDEKLLVNLLSALKPF